FVTSHLGGPRAVHLADPVHPISAGRVKGSAFHHFHLEGCFMSRHRRTVSTARAVRPSRNRAKLWLERLEHRDAPAARPGVSRQNPVDPLTKVFAPLSTVRVGFDTAIDPATFTPGDVSFNGPSGPITVNSVTPVAGSGNFNFDIAFTPGTKAGTYTFSLGPDIRDATGRQMDQSNNNIAGENPNDRFTGNFNLYGPIINGRSPARTPPA